MKPQQFEQARFRNGRSPLLFDVRGVTVPPEWAGCEFEFRHGYGKGLEADGITNPVSHRAHNMARCMGTPSPREAWFAGYRAGKLTRQTAEAEAPQ